MCGSGGTCGDIVNLGLNGVHACMFTTVFRPLLIAIQSPSFEKKKKKDGRQQRMSSDAAKVDAIQKMDL